MMPRTRALTLTCTPNTGSWAVRFRDRRQREASGLTQEYYRGTLQDLYAAPIETMKRLSPIAPPQAGPEDTALARRCLTFPRRCLATVLLCLFVPAMAAAQTIETVGERALGMGGAFVAVADDSSGTWWNPAALATGPFVDLSAAWARTEQRHGGTPVARGTVTAMALSTPPLGLSYYRFSI